jgi:hypothetical protein
VWRWFLAAALVLEVCWMFPLLRLVLKETLRFFICLDLWCVRVVRWVVPPKYVLLGACDQRGACCKQIVGDPPGWVKRTPWLMRCFVGYHRMAHAFEQVATSDTGAVIFRCGHLQRDGRCGIYRYRPRLCRDYPVLGWTKPPSLLPGCGYYTAARSVTRMQKRESLRILNPYVDIHHPSPDRTGRASWQEYESDYIKTERN